MPKTKKDLSGRALEQELLELGVGAPGQAVFFLERERRLTRGAGAGAQNSHPLEREDQKAVLLGVSCLI